MTVSKEQLAKAARKDIREAMGWDAAHEWKFSEERDTFTPEELARVTSLQAQWKALCEQGEAEGWLSWTHDYPGSHLDTVESVVHPTRMIRVKETRASRTSRINALHEAVEAKVAKQVERQWKALQEAEKIVSRLGK